MPTIIANGLRTYYDDDDYTDPWRTDVDAVLIQHGIGRNSRFWRHWVPALAGEFRVLRRDFRGCGDSEDPGPDYQWCLDDLLEDLRAFLNGLCLSRVHYIGESLGGALGIAAAVRWPGLFKSLTLCATPSTLQARQKFLGMGHGSRSDAVRTLGMEGMVKALIGTGVIAGGTPERTAWVVQEWCRTPEHVFQNIGKLTSTFDLTALLPQVKVPTLILAPAQSPLTSLADQVALRQAIPGSRIVVVDVPGHENYVVAPETCIEATLKFIRSLRPQ